MTATIGNECYGSCEYHAKDVKKSRHPIEFHARQHEYGDHRPPSPFIRDKMHAWMTLRVPVKASGHIAIGGNSILSCKMIQNQFSSPVYILYCSNEYVI